MAINDSVWDAFGYEVSLDKYMDGKSIRDEEMGRLCEYSRVATSAPDLWWVWLTPCRLVNEAYDAPKQHAMQVSLSDWRIWLERGLVTVMISLPDMIALEHGRLEFFSKEVVASNVVHFIVGEPI